MAVVTRRFGGTIPCGVDPILDRPAAFPDRNCLFFSHGRAALRWLVATRGPFEGALVCAYTWPTVPELLESLGLEIRLYDIGDPSPARHLPAGDGRWLILIPALFGTDPWLDTHALAGALGARAMVLVDAAQTAFRAVTLAPPPGGAVLSCVHKCTALGDGALLSLDALPTAAERQALERCPAADASSALRLKARAAFAKGGQASEAEALDLARQADALWPLTVCRMTDASKADLCRLDRATHDTLRQSNAARLADAIKGRLTLAWQGDGVPFCLAVLSPSRDRFLERLRMRHVFATPLWRDARHDAARHPHAARCVRELVGLPVDQRYRPADMDILAQHVIDAL